MTVRIRAGEEKHLNGKQALALARVRKNDCNPRENDLTPRAPPAADPRRDAQPRLSARRASSACRGSRWQVPRTFRTDMSGPTLMAVFAEPRGRRHAGDARARHGRRRGARRRSSSARVERFLDG